MSSKTFPSTGVKPAFDPSASFEAVDESPMPKERKPAFNPNAHFEPIHETRQLSPDVQKMMSSVSNIKTTPLEPVSFEIQPINYQVQLSQPTFRAIPQTKETVLTPSLNEPINIEKQKDQYVPDERSMVIQKKYGEARVRQEKLNTELQSNDALYEKKIREYRRDNYTLENLKNDYKQKRQILSPQDEQSILQKEKQRQYDRPITPEDITDFKTGTILTPKLSRKFIKDLNNPEISAHAYKVDKYNEIANDPDPLNYMRFDKIDENDKNIKKGFLVYNPETKQLIKPVGIIGSAIEGTMNKLKQEDMYNFYKNASDQSIIDELENERNKPDTDEPITVPKGKLAEFVKEGSQMPISPLLAGVIGSLAGPQAGTWAATAVGAYENRKAQFTSTLPQVYNELRNQGVEKGEAFRKAKAQAENAQEIGTLVGAGQGLIGAEIGKIPFSGAYNKAIGNTLKQNGTSWGKLFAEGAAQGTIGSTGEALKNALAKQAGINRPIDEGVLENFIYNAGMAVGIGGAIKAGKGLSKIDYKNILHGLSKQPEENINAALQQKVQNGEITQKAADETQQRINEYKGLDLLIPDNVSDEARFKIQDKIKKRQEYEKQLETQDKAYHPEIKEKIKALDEEIVNLTKEGKEKPIKPESGLTKEQEKEATEIAEEWLHEGIIPDSYEGAIKKDPIGFWKFLSQQAHNTDANWSPNEGPSPEQGMREDLGDTVVDYAKELFPAPKKETPQSVSVIQPGEIKHPETITNTDNISVGELLDKEVSYKGQKGMLYQDGQTVVFKVKGANREYEIGNIDEVKNHPINDYGIEHETSVVGIDKEGNISVRGNSYKNNYSNPLMAINIDKDGNVVSVNLETKDGQKRTFRGNIAEDIAYNISLKEINKNNATKSTFEEFINSDESTKKQIEDAGLSETTQKGTAEDISKVQRTKIKSETINITPSESGAGKVQAEQLGHVEVSEHGEDTKTAEGKENGIKPTKLSEAGRKEAEELGQYLIDNNKKKIITSEVARAQETANIAAQKAGIPIETNNLLNTWDIGEYDGKPEGTFVEENWANKSNEAPKGGESFNDFTKRMEQAYQFVKSLPEDNHVVSHSKVMRALEALKNTDGKWTEETTKDFLTNKELSNAVPIRSAEALHVGQTSGNSSEVGTRVPESGEITNAQGQQGDNQEGGKGTSKEKIEPEYGDLPFKAEEGDDIVTSIKNATTRQKIEEYGLTPALQEARKTHQEVWDSALKKIAKGFDTQSLVDQLKKKPRPLTDEEDALLLIHQIQKEAAYDAVNKEINEAAEIGDYGTWEEAHLRRTSLKDDLQDIYDIGKKAGTLNARGLSARQMMADRRYSLVNMEEEYRAAQRGEPLTADQKADIERIHNEIRKAKEAYEARIKQLEGENEKLRQQAVEKKIQREAKKERIQKNIEKVKKDLSDNLDELRKIARNQGFAANPIALEAIPVIAKATKNLAKLGIVKIEQMAVHIYDALKDDYGKDKDGNYNLTVDHVMEAIEAAHNQQRLDAYKKGINKNIDILIEKLNQENVPNKPTKRPIVLDDQAVKLKAQEERLKAQYEEKVKKAELKNRTPFQKAQDTFVKWQRAFKLSHVTTLGKLSGAGLTRLITSPIEEGVGGAVSTVLPKLAQRAEGEGGLNIKAEAKAITSAFTKGMKDAAETLKLGTKGGKGKSDLDIVFGKKDALPPEAIDFFGQLHSALKAPVKRAAFERSFQKRISRNIKNGVDVSDPLVQARIATEAYKDGQRAIFMQDNFVSDSYRNWVNSLERSQKYPTAGKIAATTFQWMVPFVKVPTNIVGEVGTHAVGIPIGAAKLIHASFTKGLENLAPEEADMIMRNLKKGSVGIAALLIGYFNPNNFGGYYQKNEKRGENEPAAGEAKIFGHTIPKWLLHAPIYETMQLGATIRRVKDKMVHGEPQGLSEGVWAGALGLAEEEPLIDQPMRIAKIFENKYQREKYFGELAKGTFDPGLLQDIAKWTDPQDKRKPEGIWENIESGIPGLRENIGGSSNNGGGAGATGEYTKPTRTRPEKPHKTHR